MRRLCIAIFIALAITLISGCAQRKMDVAPEQPPTQPEIMKTEDKRTEDRKTEDKKTEGKKTEDKKTTADIIATKELPKESINEKQLSKAQPSDVQPELKELQTLIRDIHFDFDSYDINDDAKPVLKEVSAMLLRNRNIMVIIEGHCDERGTNEYNLGLGDRRANSAKEFLISLGTPSSRIETISYGEEKPICGEQTEECWAKNRRAHFVFVDGGK